MEKEQYPIDTKKPDEIYCTSCGKLIKKEAFVCPHCGVKTSKRGNEKSKTIAALIAIFLGGLGIHKFYLRKPIEGILYILWTLMFTVVYIICIIMYDSIDPDSSIWYFLPHVSEMVALIILFCLGNIPKLIAFIEGIIFLCMSNSKFDKKYNI